MKTYKAKDLLFTKKLMFAFRVDVYRDGLVEFYEWQCDHHSYDGMICNHEGECKKTRLYVERYDIGESGPFLFLGSQNDLLMESWAEIKSQYREIRLNEIGL